MARSVQELRRRTGAALAGAALLLLPILPPFSLSGQQLQFRRLGASEGLANPWVSAILRDSRGFMWFGTATGLNRYDGYTMELYRHRAGDPRTLADPHVSALYEDRSGTVWVGTRSGLSRYDRARNTFTNFMVQGGLDLVERHQVFSILEDRAGRLWLATSSGLFLFDRRTGRETEFNLPLPDPGERAVQVLWQDAQGHIWIGTQRNGLLEYDPESGRTRVFRQDANDPGSLPDNDIRAIVGDGAGRLWVGTYYSGLILLDPRTGPVAQYRHNAHDPTSISVDAIRRLYPDGAGGLWVGLENGGLDHFDPIVRRFEHNRADPNRPGGLTSNSVWALCQDPAGTLWVGTYSGGVHVATRTGRALHHYAVVPGDTTSLGFNSVLGFAQDSTGAIWVATDGGGLNRFDAATGRFRRYTTRNSSLSDDAVLAVAAARDGTIWLGTWHGGLNRFDPRTGRFTAYTTENSDLPDNHIFSVHVDREGQLWAGTWREGLVRLEASGRFTRFPIGRPGLQSQIWFIHELRDGRLLLGTIGNGLLLFDPVDGSMIRYRGEESRANSLSSSEVRAVLETETGIWVGTAGGLDWLDPATGRVRRPEVADALPGNMVSGLAADASGFLWVTTDRGLVRLDPRTGTSRVYTAADGVAAEFNARSYFRSREGMLLFGGTGGLDLVRPEQLAANLRRPPVVLTGFQLFNKPVAIGARNSPLRAQISEISELTLDHRQSVFTIEFAALDYTAPSKNEYAYRLEGFDREWTYVGAHRVATYTGLPPGRYTFHVKASNNDGVWNERGTSLRITIRPPFWGTWWFRTLAGLLLAGIVGGIVHSARRRRQRLESMNRMLAAAAEHDRERQRYLESNVLEILGGLQQFASGDYSVALAVRSDDPIGRLRQGVNTVMADRKRAEEELRQSQKMEAVGRLAGGIAHDFNNLLTVIKGNTTLALSGKESPRLLHEELNEVQRAAERAESLTRQLLAFSRKQILQPRVVSLNDVVQDLGRMLQRSVGEDVQIRTVLDPALGLVRADRGQIEQVLLNLVVNARDAMPRGGMLTISTANVPLARLGSRVGTCIMLSVRDTGSGMPPEVKERVFEPFFTTKEAGKGTGLGLATVYGIVTQSGGDVHVESEPGQGSTFTILLPCVSTPEAHSEEQVAEVMAGGSGVILLVEDEHALRRLATRVLERNGYTVVAAASGAEAIRAAEAYPGPIDLLLTDVVMPGMSGRQLSEQLLPRRPGMRLLYTSGYTEDDIVRHGVSGLGTAFLEKPFTPADLLRKVREVLQAEEQVNAAD